MGLILTSCGLFKKKKPDDAQDFYTIKGTMYNADGITPLAGKSLNFTASGIGIQRKEIALLGSAITDVNGTFEMTYNYFDRTASNGISIDQPDEELPVYGPFLREIPVNTDIARDICLVPKTYYKYRILLKGNFDQDTLYIEGGTLPNEFNSYSTNSNWTAVSSPLKDFQHSWESELIVRGSSGGYLKSPFGINYSLSREKFDLVYSTNQVPENYKEIISFYETKIETFPVVNIIELVLEK